MHTAPHIAARIRWQHMQPTSMKVLVQRLRNSLMRLMHMKLSSRKMRQKRSTLLLAHGVLRISTRAMLFSSHTWNTTPTLFRGRCWPPNVVSLSVGFHSQAMAFLTFPTSTHCSPVQRRSPSPQCRMFSAPSTRSPNWLLQLIVMAQSQLSMDANQFLIWSPMSKH